MRVADSSLSYIAIPVLSIAHSASYMAIAQHRLRLPSRKRRCATQTFLISFRRRVFFRFDDASAYVTCSTPPFVLLISRILELDLDKISNHIYEFNQYKTSSSDPSPNTMLLPLPRAEQKQTKNIYTIYIHAANIKHICALCVCIVRVFVFDKSTFAVGLTEREKNAFFFSFRVFPNLFPFAPFTIQPFPFADKFNLIPRVAVMRVCSVWCGVGVLEACF